jgi:hypothetical protein
MGAVARSAIMGSERRSPGRPAPRTAATTSGSSATHRRWLPASGSDTTSRGRSMVAPPAAGASLRLRGPISTGTDGVSRRGAPGTFPTTWSRAWSTRTPASSRTSGVPRSSASGSAPDTSRTSHAASTARRRSGMSTSLRKSTRVIPPHRVGATRSGRAMFGARLLECSGASSGSKI